MAGAQTRIVVAGVAGGIGTTTVAALLAGALGTPVSGPQLLDHSGGGLAARIDPAVLARDSDERLAVHDLGTTLYSAGLAALLTSDTVVVLVAAATPGGQRAAEAALEHVGAAAGALAPARPLLLTVQHGRRPVRVTAGTERMRAASPELVPAGLLPTDAALRAGEAIRTGALSPRTVHAVNALAAAVRAQLPTLAPRSGLSNRG